MNVKVAELRKVRKPEEVIEEMRKAGAKEFVIVTVISPPDGGEVCLLSSTGMRNSDVLWALAHAQNVLLTGGD